MRSIGIDIGGLSFKAARVRLGDGVAAEERIEAEARHLVADAEREEAGAIAALAALVEELDPGGSLAVGLAVPGAVRAADGVVTTAANFPGWRDFDIGAALRRVSGRHVAVGNDANLFALAESRYGGAHGVKSLLALTLGTGLGGGLVMEGRPYLGHEGLAGEVGHLHFMPNGALCGCGARGCIEQYASTLYLAREAPRRGLGDVVDGQPMSETGRLLATAAREGNEGARRLFEDMGQNLGLAIGGLLNVLDVEAVLVGGGLAQAWDLFGEAFESTARERCFPAIGTRLRVATAALGPRAGALGAALLAQD